MAGRVFISHASEDREIAQAVCVAIEGRGLPCWIAPRDITPGKDYAQALYDAIGECTSLVLVFSQHRYRLVRDIGSRLDERGRPWFEVKGAAS
jgi:hypothetical protein